MAFRVVVDVEGVKLRIPVVDDSWTIAMLCKTATERYQAQFEKPEDPITITHLRGSLGDVLHHTDAVKAVTMDMEELVGVVARDQRQQDSRDGLDKDEQPDKPSGPRMFPSRIPEGGRGIILPSAAAMRASERDSLEQLLTQRTRSLSNKSSADGAQMPVTGAAAVTADLVLSCLSGLLFPAFACVQSSPLRLFLVPARPRN
jgi:hypothetical protein